MNPKVLTVAILVSGMAASLVLADEPKAGQQVAMKTTVMVKAGDKEESVELRYFLFLPQGHGTPEKKDEKWPLMLFLHGAGERGDNLDLVKKHGPPKLVDEKKDFPFIT